MTKSEKIDTLIELGLTFEEVVDQSGAKAAFVKGRFTKKGLKWDAPVEEVNGVLVEVEEPAPVVPKREEGPDADSEPTVETEDDIVHSGDLVELPVPDKMSFDPEDAEIYVPAPKLPEDQKAVLDSALAYLEELEHLPTIRRARTRKYVLMVIEILTNQDFGSRLQSSMNCRYMMISPRPTRMNFYKAIFHIQRDMKQVFKNARK